MAAEQRTASLLSLVASRALAPPGGADKSDVQLAAEEEQRTQTMMYAARMKYLQEADQVKPDPLFMTRKQAQKVAQQDSIKMSLRKIEVNAGHAPRKPNASDAKNGASNAAVGWKKSRMPKDDRRQTWVPMTQAGCHFWQSQETGECRVKVPPGWEGRTHPDLLGRERASADGDDDPPFPDSFAFLTDTNRK